MDSSRTSPIYQHWPLEKGEGRKHIDKNVSPCADFMILDEDHRLQLCHDASIKIHKSLCLHEGNLPLPFIADHCWELWTGLTGGVRRPSAELHLPFIFLDPDESAVPAKLIFQEIRDQACSGALYPAGEMQGVQTDAEWDGAIEAALYHAEQNGFSIPKTSDLRWRVDLDKAPAANENLRITGRSAGVTFLLALYHHFGKVAEWNTRQAFESIISLAALPTCDQAKKALIHLGGDESKKALALQGLGLASGSQHLHVVLAGSFAGFQNIELPPSVKISHAETVEQLKSAIQEIIRRERMSALEKPQALIFEDYLKLKRKGFVGREWLFEEMDLWRFESEERALLITGDPGSGKTSLVAELIHRNPGGQVIGYHCCQSNEIGTLRPGRFVQSLAAMIASCLPCYAELIDGEKLKRALGDERCEKDPGGAFLEGILQPLQNIPTPDGCIRYILVDALDEALGLTGQRTIPDILASHIQRFPSWLRLVATTRNEPKVMQSLSGLRAKQIDATDDRNLRDLTTYLYQRLSEPSLAERLVASRTTAATAVQNISRKSCGNFLYAVQVLDGIARDDYSFANLDVLPRGLDGIYLDFFRRIYGHENTQAGEATYQRARPLLQILCTALEPLTRAELASASQLDSEEELPQMLRKLAQLLSRQIRATGEETLTFHHKSVPDWLTTHLDSNAFAVGPTKGRKRLAEFCSESLASSRAKPSWYVRRHAVEHFLEVADLDNATEALCDIEFIEARAIAQELPAMLMDYAQVAKLLPEGEKERQTEAVRQAELDRYAREMYKYAADWSRIRDGSKEKSPSLPHPVKSVQFWTEEEIAAERKRMTDTPNRLDRVKAFRVFVASNTEPLQQYATQEGFAANLARNDAPAGPVHEVGKRRLEPLQFIKLIRRFGPKEIYNPLPACVAIFEGHTRRINSVALSANDRLAVSGSCDKTVRLWDLKSGECLKVLVGHTENVNSVAISADSHLAVSCSDDRTLRLWDLDSGDCLKVLKGHTNSVNSVAISADSRRAVSGSDDRTLRLWDLDSGDCLKVLKGHAYGVRSIDLSVDGGIAISGSDDYTLRLWDLESGGCLKILAGHTNNVNSVALSADCRLAVSGSADNTLRLWSLDSGECLKVLQGHSYNVLSVAMSVDNRLALSGSCDRTLRLWDLDSGKCLKVLEGHTDMVTSVALSADGRLAVSVSGGFEPADYDRSLRLWNLEYGVCLQFSEMHTNWIYSVAMSANSCLAVSCSDDRTLRLWDLDSGDCLKVLKGHTNSVNFVTISADSCLALSGSGDGTLRLWDLHSGECLKVLEGHKNAVNSVAMSADCSLAVSCSDDRTLRLWNLDSGECLKVLEDHTNRVKSVAMSADCRLAVSGSFVSTLRLWDLNSGECLKILEGHTDRVSDFTLSSDGRLALSGSLDGTLRLWDLESGKCLKVMERHGAPFDFVVVALSSDGCCALSGSCDKTVRLWDLDSGQCIKILDGNTAQVSAVAISADCHRAFSHARDGTLQVWDLDTGECQARFFVRGDFRTYINGTLKKLVLNFNAGQIGVFDLENLH